MCRPAFTKIWNARIVSCLLPQPPVEVKLPKNIQDDEIINTGQLDRRDMS